MKLSQKLPVACIFCLWRNQDQQRNLIPSLCERKGYIKLQKLLPPWNLWFFLLLFKLPNQDPLFRWTLPLTHSLTHSLTDRVTGSYLIFKTQWQFSSEYKPFLRHQIFITFHQYLRTFPSEYFPNIHSQSSQSQNHCFKNFLIFCEKHMPQSARKKQKMWDPITVWAMPK